MSSAFTNQNRKEIALSGSDWSPHQMRNSDYDNDTVSRPTSGYDSDMWTYGKIFFLIEQKDHFKYYGNLPKMQEFLNI